MRQLMPVTHAEGVKPRNFPPPKWPILCRVRVGYITTCIAVYYSIALHQSQS